MELSLSAPAERSLRSLLPEKEEFRVVYEGKPFFFVLSSNRMNKKTFLEISLDFESKDYVICLQANVRWLLFEKKERDDQLDLFFLDKSELLKQLPTVPSKFQKYHFREKWPCIFPRCCLTKPSWKSPKSQLIPS